MNIQSHSSGSNTTRPHPLVAALYAGLGIVKWLIGIFTLTEEDRIAAGVYFDTEGSDE